MYRIGHKKRRTRHHIYVLAVFVSIISVIGAATYWYIYVHSSTTVISQTKPSSQIFDPNNTQANLRINTPLYTMELPHAWKQISENRDTRYSSIQWQMQSGLQNRWIELYTDRIPPGMPFNKIIPISITNNRITSDAISDNCVKFTATTNASQKVPSKWQDASFLCDMSNKTDNIIGVSDKVSGTQFSLSGKLSGPHTYMFVYTDRGIPEDETPIKTALSTLLPK
jgi:hypothetical protein